MNALKVLIMTCCTRKPLLIASSVQWDINVTMLPQIKEIYAKKVTIALWDLIQVNIHAQQALSVAIEQVLKM